MRREARSPGCDLPSVSFRFRSEGQEGDADVGFSEMGDAHTRNLPQLAARKSEHVQAVQADQAGTDARPSNRVCCDYFPAMVLAVVCEFATN